MSPVTSEDQFKRFFPVEQSQELAEQLKSAVVGR
jgi:hypothetical protein